MAVSRFFTSIHYFHLQFVPGFVPGFEFPQHLRRPTGTDFRCGSIIPEPLAICSRMIRPCTAATLAPGVHSQMNDARLRGKSQAIQHNSALPNMCQSLRRASLGCPSLRALRVRVMVCYVLRPFAAHPAILRVHAFTAWGNGFASLRWRFAAGVASCINPSTLRNRLRIPSSNLHNSFVVG